MQFMVALHWMSERYNFTILTTCFEINWCVDQGHQGAMMTLVELVDLTLKKTFEMAQATKDAKDMQKQYRSYVNTGATPTKSLYSTVLLLQK